ncbi:MAG: helix-turn-helix domain-containing protein [Nitrospinota bacterium]|nr:helix-turn-helix domain-containing protein [Nitrospinota bacterium]
MGGSHVLWAICGGKGGAGKTFLTANIALYLAGLGYKAGVYDADLKGPSLHTALGMREKAAPAPLVNSDGGPTILGDLEQTPFPNLTMLPRNLSSLENPPRERFNRARDILRREKFDFLLVDVEAGMRADVAEMLFSSGRGAIVITPERSCLERCYLFIRQAVYYGLRRAAEKAAFIEYVDRAFGEDHSCNLIRLANEVISQVGAVDRAHARRMEAALSGFSLGVILNMARRAGDEEIGRMFCDTVSSFYGPRAIFLGHVPFDDRIMQAERKGAPFMNEYSASDTAACLAMAGRNLMEEMTCKPQGMAGWRELSSRDYYSLLRLPRKASGSDIHAAYVALVAQYAQGSVATYGALGQQQRRQILDQIEDAFAMLSNPVERAAYDKTLENHDADPAIGPNDGATVAGVAPGGEREQGPRISTGSFMPDRITGGNLRDIRLSKRISLEQIAKTTKIRKAYLEALENETVGIFPAPVFARGFLKNYAQALGLDPAEVAGKYNITLPEE